MAFTVKIGLTAVQIGTAVLMNCLQFQILAVNVEAVICCETDNYIAVSME